MTTERKRTRQKRRQLGSSTRENVTTERKRARHKGEDSLEVVQERT